MQRSISSTSTSYMDSTMDTEISNLFGSLSLQSWTAEQDLSHKVTPSRENLRNAPDYIQRHESGSESDESVLMEVTDAQGNIQFISSIKQEPPAGCGLLHALQAHFDYPTAPVVTSSQPVEFLDTILTHREAFVTFPFGHRTCSAALKALAEHLERRSRDTSSDGDLDTAIALHNEAWLMSGWYST